MVLANLRQWRSSLKKPLLMLKVFKSEKQIIILVLLPRFSLNLWYTLSILLHKCQLWKKFFRIRKMTEVILSWFVETLIRSTTPFTNFYFCTSHSHTHTPTFDTPANTLGPYKHHTHTHTLIVNAEWIKTTQKARVTLQPRHHFIVLKKLDHLRKPACFMWQFCNGAA